LEAGAGTQRERLKHMQSKNMTAWLVILNHVGPLKLQHDKGKCTRVS
jgi:hypothetical protein